MSKFNTLKEYQIEIARVKAAIEKTNSEYLKQDYLKYLKRLQRERKRNYRRTNYVT